MSAEFLIALLQIIGLNIVLSGDNAVVIALAARALPAQQRRRAVFWGSAAAIVMRVALTVAAAKLLLLPYLKLIGAVLLVYIGVQLLAPDEAGGEPPAGKTASGMGTAIRTILVADLVMSLDNVLAVAAAAKGDLLLLVTGLLMSIPLVGFGSTLLMKLMERWPLIVTVGGALLGWVGGEMAVSDSSVRDWLELHAGWMHLALPALGAAAVIALSRLLASRQQSRLQY